MSRLLRMLTTVDRSLERCNREMMGVYSWVKEDLELEDYGREYTDVESRVVVLRQGVEINGKYRSLFRDHEVSRLFKRRVYVFVMLLEEFVRGILVDGCLGQYTGEVRRMLGLLSGQRRELEGILFGGVL